MPSGYKRALELESAKRLFLSATHLDSVEEPEDEAWAAEWSKELGARLKLFESGKDRG